MTDKQAKVIESIGPKYRAGVQKAYDGAGSPRNAIKSKCLECFGFEGGLDAIRACTSEACPLFMFRPGSGKPIRSGGALKRGKEAFSGSGPYSDTWEGVKTAPMADTHASGKGAE